MSVKPKFNDNQDAVERKKMNEKYIINLNLYN